MKKLNLTIVILFVNIVVFAQNTVPNFEIKLYFEDAKGNKDSVILGYNTKADNTIISPELGEDELLTPFDSIFDVRVVKSGSFHDSPVTGKKRLRKSGLNTNPSCALFGFLSILINAKYNPIKFTYDVQKLNTQDNKCLKNTIVTKTAGVFLNENGWYNAKDWHCLASQDELVIDMSKKEGNNLWNERTYEVLGQATPQKIRFLNFNNFLIGPCNYVSVQEKEQVKDIIFSPNPATQFIRFNLDQNAIINEPLYVEIFDIQGRLMKKEPLQNQEVQQEINIEDLSNGFYFAKIRDAKKSYFSTRFVKVE